MTRTIRVTPLSALYTLSPIHARYADEIKSRARAMFHASRITMPPCAALLRASRQQ